MLIWPLFFLCFQNPEPAAPRDPLQIRITLSDGVATVVRSRWELGFRLASSSPVRFALDEREIEAALKRLGPRFRAEAVGARPILVRGTVKIAPGAFARALDAAATARSLGEAVRKNPATVAFRVTLKKTPPDLTAERLKGITGVLARFATQTSDNAKRNRNIAIAAQSIDGTLLSPKETFSLNATVGKRTQARGFRTATVFQDGEKVPGIGGGVSQVTGTLFNAAALADLRIDEVNPHSRPVSYLPVGRDATVAYGAKDLKFTNATDGPVYIECSFAGRKLEATIWGAPPPGRMVSLAPKIYRRGSGRIDADLYRTVRMRGKVTGKARLLHHAYRWKAR